MTLRQETLLILQNIYLANKSTYLYNLIRHRVKFYSTRSSQIGNISKSNFFRNYFFPSTIPELVTECNNVFKLPLFKFVRLVVKLEMYVFCTYKQCTNYTKCIQMLIKSYMLLMMQLYVFCIQNLELQVASYLATFFTFCIFASENVRQVTAIARKFFYCSLRTRELFRSVIEAQIQAGNIGMEHVG